MNENELKTLDEENKDIELYTTDEVQVEENDGPGFGLGILIGTGIGIAATAVGRRVKIWYLHRKWKQHEAEAKERIEKDVVDVQDPQEEKVVDVKEMAKKKKD